ncbi:molybdopterin biosynthesis protein [Halanaeroarchaeum sulfurireducens]|uniref:molybdopterin biosynthesis protein n=1 Tax=Halanaeroarchaeum sulfurireducens TaxID=1604004 RepID=UPI000679DFD6|nr:molybdopterin biosynthesis protein [Halanaeroarchaeum sulfurireducens]
MTDRKQFRDLAEPSALHDAIDDLDIAAGTESVPLAEAGSRVVAERVDAGIDVPGFDRSTKDGYAVRARDTFDASEGDPVELSLVGTIEAGDPPDITVSTGEAVSIATGASIPRGADAVVPVERTTRESDEEDDIVSIRTGVAPGDNVMYSGEDVAVGDRAVGPGTVLTPRDVGLLAALGVESVPVVERPTVGIVSTGDELVRPGEPIDDERGQIYDLNTYATAAAVRAAGGRPEIFAHVEDDYDRMFDTLESAGERCDLVLSSGSTSASASDVLYRVIEDHGTLDLHGVAVKPGRPTIVGHIAETPYVGLPGNPVSALSIFRSFVASAIREAAGRPSESAPTLDGRMAAPKRYSEGRTYLLPVAVIEDADGDILVYPVDKGSGAITSLTEADGVVEMPPETEYLEAGGSVTVDLFSADTRPPTVLGIGESDPLFNRLLDRIDGPRYLPHGSREGRRRLRDGVPDFALLAEADAAAVSGETIGRFSREWGFIVSPGNPEGVAEPVDLLDVESFCNLSEASGLRSAFDSTLETIAEERDTTRAELAGGIDGYGWAVSGIRSPARRVAEGEATAGLGLRYAATELDVDFVPIGTQTLSVVAADERVEKEGMRRLRTVLETDSGELAPSMAGYDVSTD